MATALSDQTERPKPTNSEILNLLSNLDDIFYGANIGKKQLNVVEMAIAVFYRKRPPRS